jgi:HSP20 family protein
MDLDKVDSFQDIQELIAIREDIQALTQRVALEEAPQMRVDLLDLGESFRLIAEVPGVSQENLEVALHGHTLTIAGLREPYSHDIQIISRERPTGHFQRTIDLPDAVEREGAHAHLREGLLILDMPKAKSDG